MQAVTATESMLLAKFTALRSAAFGLGGTIGAAFAIEAAREWRDRGFTGLASACFNLTLTTADVPGAYDVYATARGLAAAIAASVAKS